jgi:DNA-binding MarR family transcriptional regulator
MPTDPPPSGMMLMSALGAVSKGMQRWVRSQVATGPATTLGRMSLLLGLASRDAPVSMSEFGTMYDLSPRSMTVLVDGLEREGLVRRLSHEHDKRVTLVALTPAGRRLASDELMPAQQQAMALLEELDPQERRDLLRLLGRVTDLLRERGVTIPAAPGDKAR